MSKKGNNIIGILFIVLMVFILTGIFINARLKEDKSSSYFNKEDRTGSKLLYENIMNLTEEKYPSSPDYVVRLYTDTQKLLYGDRIVNDTIVNNIIEKQRILLSNKILTTNSLEQQEQLILENIKNIKENKVKVTRIDLKQSIQDFKNNKKSYVKVAITDNLFQTYYYIYHLEIENGKWKITGWYNTDENYNIIEQ